MSDIFGDSDDDEDDESFKLGMLFCLDRISLTRVDMVLIFQLNE